MSCANPLSCHSDFASKVVLGLGAGIASRQIAWFVADKGLPEAKEVQALRKAQPEQESDSINCIL